MPGHSTSSSENHQKYLKRFEIIRLAEDANFLPPIGGFPETRIGFAVSAHLALTSKNVQFYDFDSPIIKAMNWILLIIAGLFEVGFASCLGKAKETSGAESAWWLVGFMLSLTFSMILLYKASLTLPIGTAYAVWTGIGAVGTVIMGIVFFKEPTDFWRLLFITTLIISVIGLKISSH